MSCRATAAIRFLNRALFINPAALGFALLLFLGLAVNAEAAPAVNQLYPRGLTLGTPITLVIDGSDLLPEPKLVSELAITAQTVKPGATANRVEIELTIDPAAQPGFYAVRVASGKGISAPAMVAIDHLPPLPFAAELKTIPAAYDGAVAGPQVQKATFMGKQGMRLVLDLQAQRLGSNLRPILRLYNQRGTQIAWSQTRAALGGDARLVVTLPSDGIYSVEIHDQLFRAAGPAFFRLTLGDLQFADRSFPLGVSGLESASVKVLGSGAEILATRAPVPQLIPGEFAAQLSTPTTAWTGAAPRVLVSGLVETTEQQPATAGQIQELPALPIAVTGTLSEAAQEDRYNLPVTPGQNLRFDVKSHQLGSPVDGLLMIRNEQGGQLAANDDRPTTGDPGLDFAVPAGVTKLQIAFKDMENRGGPDSVYRIEVRDLATPDFSLSISEAQINIPAGGTQVLPVTVTRQGYAGTIELSLPGLPADVVVAGNSIVAGTNMALLTLSAPAGAPRGGLVNLIGKASELPAPLFRAAQTPEVPGARYQPGLRRQLGFAISEAAPLTLAWNLPSTEKLVQGGKLAPQVQVTRAAGVVGTVRFKLLTTQTMPKKTAKVNNVDQQVDDLDRALRLEGMPVLAADQSALALGLLVPGDLPLQNWDMALVAELLAADNTTVVATSITPSLRLPAVASFSLELVGAPAAEGRAGVGPAGKFAGKINRLAGNTTPVTVTLTGLAKEVVAPKVVVPGDKAEFELDVVFPYGTAAGALANVKLIALVDAAKPEAGRSNEIAVAVTVVPGEKPPAEQPREIFEDDEKFVAYLAEGDGQVSLEATEKQTGKVSLKVTPGQRFSTATPNLGLKIRENPAAGEFRYIRFAWKKKGGTQICLQLNHDGAWGPAANGKKFRYHGGPVESYGSSVGVSDSLPEGFVIVTRDLFADFGEFTFSGIAFSPVDGEYALFDSLYLGRNQGDFELIPANP